VAKVGLEPADIDLFIPHQANIRIIEAVAKALGLPMERMFVNLDRFGNTSAASVPIALAEAVDSGRVQVGDRIVIVAFGAGLASGAVALQWTANPANGLRASSVRPDDIAIRKPVGWDPVNPVPATLAHVMGSPAPAELDLDGAAPSKAERAAGPRPGSSRCLPRGPRSGRRRQED